MAYGMGGSGSAVARSFDAPEPSQPGSVAEVHLNRAALIAKLVEEAAVAARNVHDLLFGPEPRSDSTKAPPTAPAATARGRGLS